MGKIALNHCLTPIKKRKTAICGTYRPEVNYSMSAYYTHTLEINREEFITHAPVKSLSLVDPDTYQTFVGEEADRLDMMVHLQDQMNAPTAVSWEVPNRPLNVRVGVTGNQQAMEPL